MFSLFGKIKNDLISSMVVFLVAIPLCLGIALAVNAPLFSGILAGIIGGVVVGLLSQSQVSVSGPAAGLIAVIIVAAQELGGFPAFLMALSLAGIIQVILGQLRAGFIADYVPGGVIQGLLCAIGIMIIIKQLPFALGIFEGKQAILASLKEVPETLDFTPFIELKSHISFGAMIISFVSLAFLFNWHKLKRLSSIPGPVAVVLLGVGANFVFQQFFPFFHLSSQSQLVTIPVIEKLIDFKHLLITPDFSVLSHYPVYFYAMVIAIIASIETLLNLEAAEKLDPQKRYCSRNRELVAQGVGNTISGLLGGLPITSVIVRTSVNVQTGNKTKLSTIFHGLFLLAALLFIPHWINTIPLASLAAILLFVGYKLASPKMFRQMYQRGFETFIPFVITVCMIVATDLLIGVLSGLCVSLLWLVKHNTKAQVDKKLEVYPCSSVYRLTLPQHATFLNKAKLIQTLRDLPKGAQVILDGSKADYIDNDILEVVNDFMGNLSKEKNISIRTEGFENKHSLDNRKDFINVTTKNVQVSLAPNEVLDILKLGNQRFINNSLINRNNLSQMAAISDAQHPIAVVLSCIDSRVPVERVFDVGVGDLFVVRVAGNVISEDVIASVEYACEVSGAKLVVVMGHTNCGAIEAACNGVSFGHVSSVVNKIKPAIERVDRKKAKDEEDYLYQVTKENVLDAKEALIDSSQELSRLLKAKKIGIASAVYDIKTGKVNFDIISQQQPSEILTQTG